MGFAQAAVQHINGALVRCEERYPKDAAHSVIYVVVDKDAPLWQTRLAPLHDRFFGRDQIDPLAPVRLEVVDCAMDDTLQRLAESGLLTLTMRASRPLWPTEAAATSPAPLSALEQQQVTAFREQAARRLKMARLLGEGGLAEEARAPLLEAIHLLGRALALEHRLPEPAQVEETLLPPLAARWPGEIQLLRSFLANPAADWRPVADRLR